MLKLEAECNRRQEEKGVVGGARPERVQDRGPWAL